MDLYHILMTLSILLFLRLFTLYLHFLQAYGIICLVYTFQSGLRKSCVSYNPHLCGVDDVEVRGDEGFELPAILVGQPREEFEQGAPEFAQRRVIAVVAHGFLHEAPQPLYWV